MSWLVGSSIRFARLVVALAVAVLTLGLLQLAQASVDTYPEFKQTTVEVQAEALGLSPAEVEQLITVPLEQDLLNGVPWVERITSRSLTGLSSVELVFEEGTDLYRARQVVQERMTQAHALPGVGTPPVVVQPQSSVNRVAMIGLSSANVSPIEVSVLARWQVRPRLLGVPGVANVSVWGQRDRQLQVQVDPQQLRSADVTLTRLIEATGNALWVSPLSFVEASTPGTGGFVETPNQRVGVQHVSPITSAQQLSDVVVADGAETPRRIGDVARVVEDHQPLIGDAAVDGEPTVMIVVDKFPEADTAQVSQDIAEAMRGMQPGLAGITVDAELYRPVGFIETSLSHLGVVGLLGLGLMILVIGLLFASWRTALVGLIVVPLAVTAALYVLHLGGATFSTMTVVGLAAALTVVVDDLVGEVDVLQRRLRSRPADEEARPRSTIIAEAVLAIRAPLAFATVIALLVAVPLMLLSGVAGSFTRQVALTYGSAMLVSLLLAATATPALTLLLTRRTRQTRRPAAERWATSAFDATVAASLSRRGRGIAAGVVLALLALLVLPQLGSGSVLPEVRDRNILVRLETAPGTALTEMTRVTGAMAREIRSLPGVSSVGSQVGRALTSDHVVDVNSGELWVRIGPDADQERTVAAVRSVAGGYPGVGAEVSSYPQNRLAAADPPPEADLVVRVYGDDFATLEEAAESVRRSLATVRGVVDPRVETVSRQPAVRVEVDLDRATAYGLKPGDVRREAATLVSGLLVGSLYEEQKVFDVIVWGSPGVRQNPEALKSLPITTADGGQVRLGDVAKVSVAPEPVVIQHDAVRRYVDVLAAVPDRSGTEVRDEVTTRLRGLAMPLEYRAEVVTDRSGPSGGSWLGWTLALILAAFLFLQAATRSWRAAGVLVVAVPLAGVGAVLVAPLVGGVRSAGALAALLGVVLLALRHSILFVDRARDLAETSDGPSPRTAVLTAARERVFPVVATSLAVAALVLPAALSSSEGLELLHPAAVVTLGGLVTAILVTVFLVPCLYLAFAAPAGAEPPPEPGTVELREVQLATTVPSSEGSTP